jgi:putative NADPH-quinone reductase
VTRITIIDGHPDPAPARFVHALADAYAEGAAASHELRRISIADLDFSLLKTSEDWQHGTPPPAIAKAQGDILWAEHLVFLYPLWLGDVPALLKGFLEQVARPGFAIGPSEKGFPQKLLKGRSARLIVTMGMPGLFYRLFYRGHSLKSFERNVLRFVGIAPVRHTIIGSVEKSQRHRTVWLQRIRRLGRRGA